MLSVLGRSNRESLDKPTFLLTTHHLQNKFDTEPSIHSKRIPKGKLSESGFRFGISHEAPSYFKMKHTLVHSDSYKNPHLPHISDSEKNKDGANIRRVMLSEFSSLNIKHHTNQKDIANNFEHKNFGSCILKK